MERYNAIFILFNFGISTLKVLAWDMPIYNENKKSPISINNSKYIPSSKISRIAQDKTK